jgi:dienelactone hydrolase
VSNKSVVIKASGARQNVHPCGSASLYFYVPTGTKEFAIVGRGDGGEHLVVTAWGPHDSPTPILKVTESSSSFQEHRIKVPTGADGKVWKVLLDNTVGEDKEFFLLGVPPFLASDPARLLVSPLLGDDLDVSAAKIDGQSPSGMMHRYLMRRVDQAVEQWQADYEKRKTPEEIAAYQKRQRERFLESLGGLPERTPLSPQVLGTVSRPGYRVEKIVFQSQPQHYVTALLFLPDAAGFQPPYPGVLVACGHAGLASKGADVHQSMGALLAINGMAALVFDPLDQGERRQDLSPGGDPGKSGSGGHAMAGVGCILLGRNLARFMVWDGMRAIDYLQSRPDIDRRRIGCTGSSGGGTQTAYLMALDDRIRAAAPSCYMTSTLRLMQRTGPDDPEQNVFGQIAWGPHEADFVMLRAPSPVLLCAATNDFFDVGGTWDTFRYAKRLFTRMGLAERVDLLENDANHNFNATHREGVARWMSRWLLGKDQVIIEPKIALLSEKEYRCLPDAQVMALPGARSIYDLNEAYENELARRRTAAWAATDRQALLDGVRRIAGIRKLAELPKPKMETLESVARAGYTIQKLILRPEDGIALPALMFVPAKPTPGTVVLYLHSQGKAADAAPAGPIERRVQAGETVLAVDLRGIGQTRSDSKGWNPPAVNDEYVASMLGRSCLGMKTEDVLTCARYAAQQAADGRPDSVALVAIGEVAVPALHAAALEPELFRSVNLSGMLVSWSNVIHSRLHVKGMVNLLHGVLTHYDLPDLEAVLGKKLTVEKSVDALGTPVSKGVSP